MFCLGFFCINSRNAVVSPSIQTFATVTTLFVEAVRQNIVIVMVNKIKFSVLLFTLPFIDRTIFPKDFLKVQVSVKLYLDTNKKKQTSILSEGKLAGIK